MAIRWVEIENILVSKQVDLSEIKSAMIYVASGFTFSSGFKVVKKAGVSSLTKKKVDALRSVVQQNVGGSKRKLRFCIPMLVPLLVGYALGTSKEEIGQYVQALLNNALSREDLAATLKILNGVMQDRYYASYMNKELDPFVDFFGGSKPNSFTKAVNELVVHLNSRVEQKPSPTLVRVPSSTQDKNLRRVEQTQPRVSSDVTYTEKEGDVGNSSGTYTVRDKLLTEQTLENENGSSGVLRKYSSLTSLLPLIFISIVSYVSVSKCLKDS